MSEVSDNKRMVQVLFMKYKITQITQRPRNNHAKRALRAIIVQTKECKYLNINNIMITGVK